MYVLSLINDTLLNNMQDIIAEIQKKSEGKIRENVISVSCWTLRLCGSLVIVGNGNEALIHLLHRAKVLWT